MRTTVVSSLLVIILLLLTARVEASVVSFSTSNTNVDLGQTFTLGLSGNGFTDILDGGGVNLSYDPSVLAVNSITVDTSVWGFFDNPGTIDNTNGDVSDLMFASFSNVTGDFAIATLEFKAVGVGTSPLSLTESSLNPFASGGSLLAVTLQSASVTVTAVPLPAAFWLMLSGLGVLGSWLKKAG